MPSIGVLIVFAVIGAYICGKARFPGGTVVFSLLALIMFVSTPAGSGLPGALSSFLTTVDSATTPALTHTQDAGVQR
jgi:hypothetical protein